MSTLEALQEILVKEFSLDRDRLTPDAELESLGIDSLSVLDLMFKIEDRFGLQITDDVPTSLKTLNDVVCYIDALLKARSVDVGTDALGLSRPK